MAKRAPADDAPYNPLDVGLAHSVVKGAGMTQEVGKVAAGVSGEGGIETPPYVTQGALNGKIVGLPRGRNPAVVSETAIARSLNREKRVLLTPEEERHIERLVDRIGEQLGASLKLSHLLRTCMTVLCHAENEILRHASNLCPLPRPANGDAVALAQFEQALARLLSVALRDAPPIR
jgi:hypothetical protein